MICFEELVNYYLFEKISKKQEENIKPFVQLKKYLFNKWENKKLNKEQSFQKRIEYCRFNYLIEMSKNFLDQSNKTGSYLDWLVGSSDLFLGTKKEIGGGFKFKINDKKLTTLYKNGRLYDFLKSVIETEKGNIYEQDRFCISICRL